jgi:hypothetical protein
MFAYVMSDRTTIWAAVWRPFDAAILVPVWPTVRATIRTAHQLTVNAAYRTSDCCSISQAVWSTVVNSNFPVVLATIKSTKWKTQWKTIIAAQLPALRRTLCPAVN